MNGNDKFLLDTNIVLYFLNGDEVLFEILDKKTIYISFITEMELLSYGKYSVPEETKVKEFLGDCYIVEMNAAIKQQAIKIRKAHKLKLPDSIIAATTIDLNIPLLTADIEFNKLKSMQILQYNKQ